MRHNKEDVDPHEPEMPDTRCVIPSKKRSQPMELHRFMNRPACSDRKKPGDRNRKVRCTLERVVLCVETGMQPFAAYQFCEGNAEVVPKHHERIKQISPARQQGAPSSSHEQSCKVHH